MGVDILTQRILTGVVRAWPDQGLLGATILPEQPIDSWSTMWDVLGRDSKLAPFVAVDGESSVAPHPGIERVVSEVADIRQKEAINESDVLSLRMPGEPEVVAPGLAQTRAQVAEANIRLKLARLTARVRAREEWMRWQALATGTVAMTTGPVRFSVSFSIPGSNITTLTSTAKWSDTANSNPINDLATAVEALRLASGRAPATAYVGAKVPGYLVKNAAFRELVKQSGLLVNALSTDRLLDFLGQVTGLNIVRYDSSYQDDTGTVAYFLPESSVVIVPAATQPDGERLGDVAVAPAAANNYEPGLYSWVTREEDPWQTFVGVGIHAFPRIYHPDWIGIIKTNG